MVFAGELLFLVELLLLVYCVLSIITTPDDEIRHLPKLVWLVLVVLLPLAGGLAWLVAGRARDGGPSLPYKGNRGSPSGYDRPGPAAAKSPDDDAAFLRGLQERADAQRAEAARRQREEREREDRGRDEAGPE